MRGGITTFVAMATALSVNAVVAFQVAPQVTWEQAMGIVVMQGLFILLPAATGVRTLIVNAIPRGISRMGSWRRYQQAEREPERGEPA